MQIDANLEYVKSNGPKSDIGQADKVSRYTASQIFVHPIRYPYKACVPPITSYTARANDWVATEKLINFDKTSSNATGRLLSPH
jgi:hypothetical protein